jgi:hypothetical protein
MSRCCTRWSAYLEASRVGMETKPTKNKRATTKFYPEYIRLGDDNQCGLEGDVISNTRGTVQGQSWG